MPIALALFLKPKIGIDRGKNWTLKNFGKSVTTIDE